MLSFGMHDASAEVSFGMLLFAMENCPSAFEVSFRVRVAVPVPVSMHPLSF